MKYDGVIYVIVGRYAEVAAILASEEGYLSSHSLAMDGKLPSKWTRISRRWRGRKFCISWDLNSQEFRVSMDGAHL